jgi:AMP-binding enzyme
MPDHPLLSPARDYDALYGEFRWQLPATYNIGVEACDRWAVAEPDRLALIHVRADGGSENVTYGWLRATSNRLANALAAHGIKRGDRVAILLPQSPEVVAIHVAVYKLGAVALPLASVFGVDALSYRLQNAGVKALLTNAQGAEKLAAIRADLPDLTLALSLDGAAEGMLAFADVLARASADFRPIATTPDDPAMMIYTSGTTGSGRRPTGPGRADCSIACCRASPTACPWWRVASTASIPRRPSRSWRRPACAMPSSRRPRCACCARRRVRAGGTRSRCARSARAAKASGPRPTSGAGRRSA